MTDTAFDRLLDALEAHGSSVTTQGTDRAKAQCPAHADRTPSLSLTAIPGRVLVKCWADCETADVLGALGLKWPDLFDSRRGVDYRYDSGRVVHRSPYKKFRQSGDLSTVELYHLAEVKKAVKQGRRVFLVEGEQDADALSILCVTATTAPMGAESFHRVDVTPLTDARVVVVVDQDQAGAKWAATVARMLTPIAKEVHWMRAAVGKDAADHVAAGHGIAEFVRIESPEPAINGEVLAGRQLLAISAATITMKAPRWLYDWRIPAGAITLLGGREGIGKSTISYGLAAQVTLGSLPGRFAGTPRGVAVVAGEDSWESVILPRLVAAGADTTRVYRVEATDDGRADVVSVPADLDQLGQLAERHDVALVILDPLMSVIHGSLDTHKDREVRQALDPLSRFASSNAIAVLGLIHVNKTATTDPLTSIMASKAFTAVARSVLYCVVDPDAEREDRYLFGHVKSNLGPKQPTLNYRLITVELELDDPDEPTLVTSRVVWDGTDLRTIRDALEAPRKREDSETTTRILEWLAAQGRAVSAKELATEFSDIKRSTLDKHLSRLVDRGKITRPFHGLYTSTLPEVPALPEQTEVPEVPEDSLADLADLAS